MAKPSTRNLVRVIAAVVLAGALVGMLAAAKKDPDPLAGPRPEVADMASIPRVVSAYQAFRKKNGAAPTPAQLAQAVRAEAGKGKVPAIVGGTERKPGALRLAGTPEAPRLELLDERGEVALYGTTPVAISMEVPQ